MSKIFLLELNTIQTSQLYLRYDELWLNRCKNMHECISKGEI